MNAAVIFEVDGGTCTHYFLPAAVEAGKVAIRSLLATQPHRPGDLEDALCGEQKLLRVAFGLSDILEAWRDSPFFPALAHLINDGEVSYKVEKDGEVWYSLIQPAREVFDAATKIGIN